GADMHAPRPLLQRFGRGPRQRCGKPGAYRARIDDPLSEQRAAVKQPIARNPFGLGRLGPYSFFGHSCLQRVPSRRRATPATGEAALPLVMVQTAETPEQGIRAGAT